MRRRNTQSNRRPKYLRCDPHGNSWVLCNLTARDVVGTFRTSQSGKWGRHAGLLLRSFLLVEHWTSLLGIRMSWACVLVDGTGDDSDNSDDLVASRERQPLHCGVMSGQDTALT